MLYAYLSPTTCYYYEHMKLQHVEFRKTGAVLARAGSWGIAICKKLTFKFREFDYLPSLFSQSLQEHQQGSSLILLSKILSSGDVRD